MPSSPGAPLLLLTILLLLPDPACGQRGVLSGDWPSYGGDAGSTKYSSLDQLHQGNIGRAKVVWRWQSPDDALALADPALSAGQLKGTPILVDGVLYLRTSLSMVAAIDGATGKELWSFDPLSYRAGRPTNFGFNTRGVAYWTDGVERRILVATGDAHLWALDASTGAPIRGFGSEGRIDLTEGLRRPIDRADYTVMSPPLVVGNRVIVGSAISDVPRYQTMPPGDVRAFDVRTGELSWVFHTIPQPGEFGHGSWEKGSWAYTGNTNVWTMMSADEEAGLVYLPVGTPTNDWYGGHRPGDNLFAESLVALRADTGERVWHYQLVHHGVWDYDPPAAPILVDLEMEGRPVPVVAQITKQGFVFLFDRLSGEPVWPIEERPVAQSAIPGERLSPTQPFPTRPPPFERQGISAKDLIDFTPELRAEAEEILEQFEYGDLFHPPSLKGTINLPGWLGGAGWQGAAVDPQSGTLFIPSRTSPIRVQLVEPDPERSDFRYMRDGGQAVPGPRGLPLVQPPHVRITAIDLNEGEQLWQIPLGDGVRHDVIELGVPDPGPLGGGTFTGPLLTGTMLLIGHSGARDGNPESGGALLAFDKETGAALGSVELPGTPTGTPITYRIGEKQYVAVAYTGEEETGLFGIALE